MTTNQPPQWHEEQAAQISNDIADLERELHLEGHTLPAMQRRQRTKTIGTLKAAQLMHQGAAKAKRTRMIFSQPQNN